MQNLTVVIHSRNSEKDTVECIQSAKLLTNDIVLVDMRSTDRTTEIAKKQGAKVYLFEYTRYVEPARGFGIEKAEGDWVFILDTDERITKELASEIKQIVATTECSFFRIPRKNIFGKKQWLKHGGWWPDLQIRLIRKGAFRSWPKRIHSTPVIDGSEGVLTEPILHYFHGDLTAMVEKTIIFEQIESQLLFEAGRKTGLFVFFRKFLGELFRRLIKGVGFLDGTVGIIEGIYQAYSKTITYLYLYEKKKSRTLQPLS